MKTSFRLTKLSLLVLAAASLTAAMLPPTTFAAERTLAGIRTFSPISTVLKRFGDPTFIASGTQVASVTFLPSRPILMSPNAGGMGNSPYNSDTPGNGMQGGPGQPGAYGQQGGQAGGYGGQPPGYNQGSGNGSGPGMGQAPGMSQAGLMGQSGGYGQPGGMGQQGMNGGQGGAVAMEDPFDPLYDHATRYYYDDTKAGLIFEFVATGAGRVVEIKVYGYHSAFKTSEGIGLGSNYAQIVLKYGYPEKTINDPEPSGDVLTLVYTESAHVAFRLVRNKVAVISVVAPD